MPADAPTMGMQSIVVKSWPRANTVFNPRKFQCGFTSLGDALAIRLKAARRFLPVPKPQARATASAEIRADDASRDFAFFTRKSARNFAGVVFRSARKRVSIERREAPLAAATTSILKDSE